MYKVGIKSWILCCCCSELINQKNDDDKLTTIKRQFSYSSYIYIDRLCLCMWVFMSGCYMPCFKQSIWTYIKKMENLYYFVINKYNKQIDNLKKKEKERNHDVTSMWLIHDFWGLFLNSFLFDSILTLIFISFFKIVTNKLIVVVSSCNRYIY